MRSPSVSRKVQPRAGERAAAPARPSWTFLTNHAHVLLCVYLEPESRLREVAQRVGITERMVQKIVTELAEAGYLVVQKYGRCNHYQVQRERRLRHPLESQLAVGQLLELLSSGR